MAAISLSKRDLDILGKIRDPESNPTMAVLIDPSLPKDPNVTDQTVYDRVSRAERDIVLRMQQAELQLAETKTANQLDAVDEYRACVSELGRLIREQPKYASARNNRAQALRRLYGDSMLLGVKPEPSQALLTDAGRGETVQAAAEALSDLDKCIALLSPPSMFAALSPAAAKVLSLAHTQRAAIYHATSKLLGSESSQVEAGRKEAGWSVLDFETAASRDFALGGRYGNEIAKGLAVVTNPTAKLCGQMVREMMKKEYGAGLA